MARKSAIETSKYKDYIESELLAGVAYRQLAEDLEGLGFSISHTALGNYHKDKLGGVIEGPAQEPYEIEPIEFDSDANNGEAIEDLYKRQLDVVGAKLNDHMNGDCKFPSDEVRGLKAISSLTSETLHDTKTLGLLYKMVLQIVQARQKECAEGLRKYPATEVAALKTIASLTPNSEKAQ